MCDCSCRNIISNHDQRRYRRHEEIANCNIVDQAASVKVERDKGQ